MKNYDNKTTSSYLMYLDASNLYGWYISQKSVNGFEWVEELSQFYEDFIKDYDENNDERYFFEVDAEYPEHLFIVFIIIYHFYLKGVKFKNAISFFLTFMTRETMLFT